MQGAWQSPNMLPTMVHSQVLHIRARQTFIKSAPPICHLRTGLCSGNHHQYSVILSSTSIPKCVL